MALLAKIKKRAIGALQYLGDEAHRRVVVAGITYALVHFGGKEIAPEVVDSGTEMLVTMLAAAWSSRTPKLEQADG